MRVNWSSVARVFFVGVGCLVVFLGFKSVEDTQNRIHSEAVKRCIVIRALVDEAAPQSAPDLTIPAGTSPEIAAVVQPVLDTVNQRGAASRAELQRIAKKYLPECSESDIG